MNLQLTDAYAGPDPDLAVEPKVFFRTFTAPSGLPWEQRQAAELEARMAAPAALAALRYRLIRLEAWGFGKPGRFAVVYLRGGAGLPSYEAQVLIDGRTIKVAFLSEATRRGQRLQLLRDVTLVVVPLVLIAAAVIASLDVSAARETRIAALEAKVQRAELLASRAAAERVDTLALLNAGVRGRTLSDTLRDLDWLSRFRAPEAHIQAVHWENGLMIVTVRGDSSPVRASEREVRRSDRPVGKALWLWGVGAAAKTDGS